MNCENIMLNERSQSQRPCIAWFYLYTMSRIGRFIIEIRLVIVSIWGSRKWGVTAYWLRKSIWVWWKCSGIKLAMVAQPYEYTKKQRIVHFKRDMWMSWYVNSSSVKVNCTSSTECLWWMKRSRAGFRVNKTWVQVSNPFLPSWTFFGYLLSLSVPQLLYWSSESLILASLDCCEDCR